MFESQDYDDPAWAQMARDCWVKMALYPKASANWELANAILHCLASYQFPVYDYKPDV